MNILKFSVISRLPQLLLSVSIVLLLFLTACKKDPTPGVETEVGKWQLVEVLFDPGDGSGGWQEVDEDMPLREIEFKEDGSFLSNMPLCPIVGIQPDTPGTYSKSEQTITTNTNCEIPYSFEDGFIILSFQCIEPCLEKFKRIP